MRFFAVYLKNCDQKWSWQLYRPPVFLKTPIFQDTSHSSDHKNSKSNEQCDYHKLSEFDTYYYLYLFSRVFRTYCNIYDGAFLRKYLNAFSHTPFLQNSSIIDVRLDFKYASEVLSLPLTTTTSTTSFP